MKSRNKTEEQAIAAGMMSDTSGHCPECGCPWYGNKNLLGEGSRCCFDCYQDWWTDVKYDNQASLRELPVGHVENQG